MKIDTGADLSKIDLPELRELEIELNQLLKRVAHEKVARARERIEQLAEEVGLPISEIVANVPLSSRKRVRRPARKKYCNPEAPTVTWTGKGRKPKWVVEHLAKGGQLSELLIRD
jgi:DNA-binding protein H-NS